MTGRAGLMGYEVSNHARDMTFQSRHNLGYWNGGDWLGIGPGAHGRVTVGGARYATLAEKSPETYVSQVSSGALAWSDGLKLTPLEIARELFALGLRPSIGIDLQRIEAVSKTDVSREKIGVFVNQGWAQTDGKRLWLTPSGWLLADAITAELSP
jgi:oxygen-independent coproporphyrinogen-3 oxidase